jgi:ribA/ribD-fused uncharacterized protein
MESENVLESSVFTPSNTPVKGYDRRDSVVFLKTREEWGGLSNMCGGYPLHVNGIRILNSESLYQSCRYPHLPEVQEEVISKPSPMGSKMTSKKYRNQTRSDWDEVRVDIMRWCLRVKLVQNFRRFSSLLLETGDLPIVEQSRRDRFWGSVPMDDTHLVGQNVLGNLLMELREELQTRSSLNFLHVKPLDIPVFRLEGHRIGVLFD